MGCARLATRCYFDRLRQKTAPLDELKQLIQQRKGGIGDDPVPPDDLLVEREAGAAVLLPAGFS
jgi:hypothetical protein